MSDSDSEALRDPSYAAGRVMALEAELVRERSDRRLELERERAARREELRTERQERDEHDTLVSAALADVRNAVHELQGETVRQGGVIARTHRIAEATARHLGLDPDSLEPVPDVPVLSRMGEAEDAIDELRLRRARQATRPDPEEAAAGKAVPARQDAPERPITPSFRPRTVGEWTRLAVAGVLALTMLAAAAQQIAQALSGH
jgi:hypothetical protein